MAWHAIGWALAWVIGGNFVIHLAMKRVHARLRERLASSPRSFEEADVRGTITATALLGLSVRWSRGDLVVCDRCVAFLQRNVIAQPPVLLFRSEAEARAFEGAWLVKVWLTADPVLDADGVTLLGRRAGTNWKLEVRTKQPRALADAVRAMRHAPPPSPAAYR